MKTSPVLLLLIYSSVCLLLFIGAFQNARGAALQEFSDSSGEVNYHGSDIKKLRKQKESDEGRAERKKRKRQQQQGGKKDKKRNRDSPERTAVRAWADSLTEQDYDEESWRKLFHSHSASDFFNAYSKRISNQFKEQSAKVNFALIGACDGLGDNTIKHIYLPNDHWRGVFVEPMSINVRDLIKFLADKNVAHRSVVIRAAATSKCLNSTILVERPLYEEKNASLPHWLRRQIGSVLPKHRDHARKEWTIEEVKCITAREVLREWAAITTSKPSRMEGGKSDRFRRPHVLKIDVEGHDFEVLMGFLTYETPVTELPLIIGFEAKSIAKKYPIAKARMEELGYAVTSFGQDGFALLKKDRVLESISANQIPMGEELDV